MSDEATYYDQTTVLFNRDSRDPIALLKNFPVAAARLERLMHQRDDAGAIGQRVELEKLDLREAMGRLDGRVRELKAPSGSGGHGLTDGDPRVQTVVRERDELRDKFKRLDARGLTISPTRQTSGQLYGNCKRYVLSRHNLSAVGEVKPVTMKRGEAVADAIERHRQRLSNLESERERVRSAPLPSANAKEKMRAQISALAERGKPEVNTLVATGGEVSFPTAPRTALVANLAPDANQGAVAQWSESDAVGLVCWLHHDALLKKLDQEIEAAADDKAALTAEDRAAKISDLEAAVLDVERSECALVWHAAETGAPLSFREQADPRAVLGLE